MNFGLMQVSPGKSEGEKSEASNSVINKQLLFGTLFDIFIANIQFQK